MSSTNMQEYLKKYMSPSDQGEKKKRKKKRKVPTKVKIFDDDVTFNDIAPKDDDSGDNEYDMKFLTKEEKPQEVVIDNRSAKEKSLDMYKKSDKWKTLNDDEKMGGRSKLSSHNTSTKYPPRKKMRHNSDSDQDVRRTRQDSDSDQDVRRTRHDSDSDQDKKQTRHDSDSDQDVRRTRLGSDSDQDIRRTRHDSDSDQDVRRNPQKSKSSNRTGSRHDSDSDLDIPRNSKSRDNHSDSDLDMPRVPGRGNGKQMSDGRKGGLTSAKALREDTNSKRNIDKRDLQKLANKYKDTKTVHRGKKKTEEEEADEEAKRKKREELEKKYNAWGSGLKQTEQQQKAVADTVYESTKSLTRRADDADLEQMRKDELRAEDPMAAYIRNKASKSKTAKKYPKYTGPAPAPNRFNIGPGYRWDGVDRSNGFEAKYYNSISNSKADNDDYYKWSVSDM